MEQEESPLVWGLCLAPPRLLPYVGMQADSSKNHYSLSVLCLVIPHYYLSFCASKITVYLSTTRPGGWSGRVEIHNIFIFFLPC